MVKTITPLLAKNIIDTIDVTIIDVREEHEYKEGHIKDSINIPLNTIEANKGRIPDKTLLVYCRSGRRSAIAAKKLENLGYKDVYDFGGIQDWPYEVVK